MERKSSANHNGNVAISAVGSRTMLNDESGRSPHTNSTSPQKSAHKTSSCTKDASPQVEASSSSQVSATKGIGAGPAGSTQSDSAARKVFLKVEKHASMPNLEFARHGRRGSLPRRLNQLNQTHDRLIRGPSRTSSQYLHQQLQQQQQQQQQQEQEMESNSSDDETEPAHAYCALDQSQMEKYITSFAGPQVYVENGKRIYGRIDRRVGLSPFTTFVSRDGPSTTNAKLGKTNPTTNPTNTSLASTTNNQPVACGLCSSTNLVWTLQCSFCGCHRMSTAPRLKYIMDMIISVEPLIKAEDFSKKILEYAKFDRVALKAEQKFKQASLLRAKTAIIMMNRTISGLRKHMLRMIFNAWKRYKHLNGQRDQLLVKALSIKERQSKLKRKQISFFCWRGYSERIREERNQRLSIAMRHSEFYLLQRCLQSWRRYIRLSEMERKEKRDRDGMESDGNPSNEVNELDCLREGLRASRELAFGAMETLLEILERSQQELIPKLIQTYELKQMFPLTVSPFVDYMQTKEMIECFKRAEPVDPEVLGLSHDKQDELFQQAKVKLEQVRSYDTVLQWINYQRVRNAEMANAAASSSGQSGNLKKRNSSISIGNFAGPSSLPGTVGATKKKEVREIKDLQDLRNSISSPSVMLKLVCHISRDAQMEYERLRVTEKQQKEQPPRDHPEDVTSPTSGANALSSSGYPSGSSQMQLRWLFKLISRVLRLPDDFLSRDAFLLNDFDALYEFLVYLFSFFPNWTTLTTSDANWLLTNDSGLPTVAQVGSVAAATAYSCQYPFGYERLTLQWHKAHQKLLENHFDAFSQQQFVNLLNKAKLMHQNQQFVERGIDMINQLARLHQQRALRDSLTDLSRRVLGKDSKICLELERETWGSFVHLNVSKVLPLCSVGETPNSTSGGSSNANFGAMPTIGTTSSSPSSAMDQFTRIEQIFKTHVLDLMKIFQMFAKDSGAGLSEQEFLKIMTKAGVTDKKNMLRSHLQAIYQQSRQASASVATSLASGALTLSSLSSSASSFSGPGGGAEGSASGEGSGTSSIGSSGADDRGASPNEFFEALTRVAYFNMLKRQESALTPTLASIPDSGDPGGDEETGVGPDTPTEGSQDWSSTGDTLSDLPSLSSTSGVTGGGGGPDSFMMTSRASVASVIYPGDGATGASNSSTISVPTDLVDFVRELVADRIVPLTRKFQEQGLTFKKLLIHPEVQHVLKNQEKRLRKIFSGYSAKHSIPSNRGKFMEVAEFESFCKDKHFVDAFFPHGKIKQLVCFVQQDGDVNSSMMNGENKNEFDYEEFVEALCAIAVYRNANPYVPLAKKLDVFFDQSL